MNELVFFPFPATLSVHSDANSTIYTISKSDYPLDPEYNKPFTKEETVRAVLDAAFPNMEYRLPSGNTIVISKYVYYVLEDLFHQGFTEDDIVVENTEVIQYKYKGRVVEYRPDIYIKSSNLVIEVVSIFTNCRDQKRNDLKLNAIRKKHNYELVVFDGFEIVYETHFDSYDFVEAIEDFASNKFFEFPSGKRILASKYITYALKDLLDEGIKEKDIVVQNVKSIKYLYKGKRREYEPDIYVKSLNLILEVRTPLLYPRDQEKHACMMEAIRKKHNAEVRVYNKKKLVDIQRFERHV